MGRWSFRCRHIRPGMRAFNRLLWSRYARPTGEVAGRSWILSSVTLERPRFSVIAFSSPAPPYNSARRFAMKVFAIHDAAGTISDIITAPDRGPAAGIVPRAG